MRTTRRFRALAAAGIALAVVAVLAQRPLLLSGAAGVGGYLLARQYAFVRRVGRLDAELAVDVSLPDQYVIEDDTTPVTLSAATVETPLAVTVTGDCPASVEGPPPAERRVEPDGPDPVTATYAVTWSIAGTVTFDPPAVAVADAGGLFRETFERGPAPTVTVEPRRPRRLHVGQGGDQIAATFGEHAAGQLGEGLDPAELRQYVPGDAAADIDWKATARLNEPHVREHEVETDRRTVVLFDHRHHLGEGRVGERKIDYLREVAVAFAGQARDLDDPLGLVAVGDEGQTAEHAPTTEPDGYRAVRATLNDLVPTEPTGESGSAAGRSPGEARRASADLADDGSAFGATLRPFFDDVQGYVRRIEQDPLFATAESTVRRLGGTLWTFVFTDDRNRAELRETVNVARRDGGRVVVFLAPDALFSPGDLSDLESAYARYVDFEEFRRELDRMDRVAAYEVGPGDRIDAVLGSRR